MSYTTAALAKQLSYQITDLVTRGVISDSDITDLAAALVDPEIDGALDGFGAPFTGTVPAVVQMISALLTDSTIFEDRLSHEDKESGWAQAKRDQAANLLTKIREGEIKLTGVEAPPLMVLSDPEADRPKTEVFAGDPTMWQQRTETRER